MRNTFTTNNPTAPTQLMTTSSKPIQHIKETSHVLIITTILNKNQVTITLWMWHRLRLITFENERNVLQKCVSTIGQCIKQVTVLSNSHALRKFTRLNKLTNNADTTNCHNIDDNTNGHHTTQTQHGEPFDNDARAGTRNRLTQ